MKVGMSCLKTEEKLSNRGESNFRKKKSYPWTGKTVCGSIQFQQLDMKHVIK